MPSTLAVAMPNYNHAAYLAGAIDAIVNQSRAPDEFLILDDASTDESVRIIEPYLIRFPFVRLIRLPKNRGGVAAMQTLLTQTACDYVYFAAADDRVHPDCLAKAMAAAEQHPQAGIVFGKMASIDAAGNKIRDIQAPPWSISRFVSPEEYLTEYLDRQPVYRSLTGATVFKRNCLNEVGGFRAELGSWCDTFAMRAIALKYGAAYVPETFMSWRKLPNSLSHGGQRRLHETLAVLNRAAALMRSEAFRARFPESHVRRWHRRYRFVALINYFRSMLSQIALGVLSVRA